MNTISPITTAIILITGLTSMLAFNNQELKYKLMFYPYEMKRHQQWYRSFTSGFIHADWMHLLFNMITLYSFGPYVETFFIFGFGKMGPLLYLLMYVLGIIVAELYSYFKHQDDYGYTSLGASGAVSAVIFAGILLHPWNKLYFFGVVGIPGIIFGVLFLIFSQYKAQKNDDHIGHNAHFYGAIFGFIFPIVFKPAIFIHFIEMLKTPNF